MSARAADGVPRGTPPGHAAASGAASADGYARLHSARGAAVVALASLADTVAAALTDDGTLHEYGARRLAEGQVGARRLQGRGPVYAVTLPDGHTRVVIRHAMHGGLLAPITGDRFLAPTRAPIELAAAIRLARAGVRTPEVVAYALYPAGPLLRRSDVATREVAGRDLGESLRDRPPAEEKRAMLAATAGLLAALARAGARHPDLNVKNVLIARDGTAGAPVAHVLDVDRIRFLEPGHPRVAGANLARLARSVRKWRALHGIDVTEQDLAWLAEQAAHAGR
ncbi:MAG: lipopolysaccharide kinase InaA family protein [Gemmatimonadaceae bacterium]